MLLDLEIRKRSNNAKSLDDVLRYLYTEFFKKNRNYGPADFQKASELMAGSSLEDFFSKYVRGTEELDYNAALEAAGLRLDTGVGPVERVYFGADVVQEDDRLVVRRVYAGSPAYEQGLNAGDQIVALDNMRVTRDFFNARIAEKKPGDLINLTIFRFDELSTLLIKLGGRREGTYRIVPLPNQTEAQKRVYRSWLGELSRRVHVKFPRQVAELKNQRWRPLSTHSCSHRGSRREDHFCAPAVERLQHRDDARDRVGDERVCSTRTRGDRVRC